VAGYPLPDGPAGGRVAIAACEYRDSMRFGSPDEITDQRHPVVADDGLVGEMSERRPRPLALVDGDRAG
jgi:hypothetical protein